MAGYAYIAIDMNGKERKGKMEAPDEEKVFHSLKADGYFPVSIKELGILSRDINIQITNPVKPRDLSVFTRQFVSILNAGVPIVTALDMLVEQTENKTLRKAISSTLLLVEKGERLADAMRNQGKIFPPVFINMVEAGETSGSLEVALERMAVHFEKEAKLKALLKKASVYPASLGIISLAVIVLMLAFVIPTFMDMFADMDMEMPKVTLAIMSASNFLINRWYFVLGIIVIISVALIIYKNTYSGKMVFAKIGLKLPLIGKLNIKTASARFSRTLSTLLAAGIPLMDAIDITARTMDNILIKKMLMQSKEEVARGVPLSIPLMSSGIFPPMVYHMTKIGEETGNIEVMLNKIADYYDEEVEVATQALVAAMEPLIIIIMAVVVGGLILAILQPMFSMYEQMDSSLMGGDPGAGIAP
ncbi:type II secretion system F family protein [Mobilitalea sibirica]|uniref:Type II secretion system F family protein n=1 Tax=Mobilitalea sibirica TaxID=1462919 RepID=A0A8J7H4Y8_9FIRM|nr:type II secretion system F family protein [Mobilitalea sibirica]MBH1939781.1 type II secretion system F family protein [Mobilitalea sibirica]